MIFLRFGVLAAAITLCSCSLSTAPEPPEFKLSAAALGKQYRATRKTGSVSLYAGKIKTSRDEWGRETHLASGGALLVKETSPPILALAPSISITPEFSEVRGQSTVKKNDLLYLGQDESTAIRIDGTAITPEGSYLIRAIAAAEVDPPTGIERADAVATSLAYVPTFGAKEAPAATPPSEPVEVKPKTVSKPKRKARPSPARKPASEVVKASAPPPAPAPAPKPKAAPTVDRSKLLNLMREPTVR